MDKAVSATDANRKFSKLLRGVREGQSYVVTSHGNAVARIVPVENNAGITPGARNTLLKRLGSERVVRIGRWRRDELYETKSTRAICWKPRRGQGLRGNRGTPGRRAAHKY